MTAQGKCNKCQAVCGYYGGGKWWCHTCLPLLELEPGKQQAAALPLNRAQRRALKRKGVTK